MTKKKLVLPPPTMQFGNSQFRQVKTMPEPPPPPSSKPWLAGCIMICERVYQDKTNLTVIAGNFSTHTAHYEEIPQEMPLLPIPPSWIYVRFQTSGPQVVPWKVVSRTELWCNEPDNRAGVIAEGNVEIKPENLDYAEFFFKHPSHGFVLTPERKVFLKPKSSIRVDYKLELWSDEKFISAQRLVFVYSIGKVLPHVRPNDESSGEK